MAYTQAQLVAAFTAANNGVAPDAATQTLLGAFAAQNQAGQLSDSAVLAYVINSAQDDVEVAVQAYQFFTGKIPTKAGLDFLTNSTTNTTDLNDPYYAQFSLENRYMNFAANLGLNGEGAAAFASTYGSMNFATFVGTVYEQIIGSSYANAAKINVAAALADIISRQANFTQTARDRGLITSTSTAAQIDLATKAAVVGYLMAEGVKADVGIYAAGANNFVNALIAGNAQYGVSLTGVYSPLGGGIGSPVPGNGATGSGQVSVNPETITANVFNAPQAYTPGGNDLVNTLQNDDQLIGTGDNPTLNVTLGNPNDNGASTITPTLRGVEVINARFDGTTAAGLNMVLDLQDAQGNGLNTAPDTINITRIAQDANATIQNIPESVATSLSVSNTQSPASSVSFTYLTQALSQTNNVGTVTLSNVNIGTLRIEENASIPTEGFETLTVNSVGSANKVGMLQAEDVQTLNITGTTNLTLGTTAPTNGTQGVEATRYGAGLAHMAGSLSKIDATGFKGNLDITLGAEFSAGKDDTSGVNIQLAVIGGDGNDTIRLNGATVSGVTGNLDTINGGAGTNTLVLLGSNSIQAAGTATAPVANVTNIQNLEVRTGHDAGTTADAVSVNADAFDKLAAIYIRNEGQTIAGDTNGNGVIDGGETAGVGWQSQGEGMTATLTNLTAAQLGAITVAHGTTGNSTIANNIVNATLKTATGAADAAQVTIVDGINSDPVFNLQFNTAGTEKVTFVDNDTESNNVFLNQGTFTQAGSTVTLTGGATGQYFSLDVFTDGAGVALAVNGGVNGGYGNATNSNSTTSLQTSTSVAAAITGARDTVVSTVLFGAGANGTTAEAQATRYVGENLVATAYLGDVTIRLGDVTRADGVSSQNLATGVGNDTFIFDALGVTNAGFTSGDTIAAGTGNDTLVIDGNTATIPGTPRIDIQTSEWDNVKGIDTLRFAQNQGVAASAGVVATTGGSYYAAIDNDFISQTDSGNRLIVVNNDGRQDVNSETDLVLDLRGLSAQKWITFVGANSNASAVGANASNRLIVDDVSANQNMILAGGDSNTTTTALSGNNNVYEVRNTANVSISDLSQTKDFGLINFTNDQATAQTLTLTLNNTVLEALVDSSSAATGAGNQEILNILATDGAGGGVAASILNVDARQVSGFHAISVTGSNLAVGNDVISVNSNVGGTGSGGDLGATSLGDRVNFTGGAATQTYTIGAATQQFQVGTTTTTHTFTNVEFYDVSAMTYASGTFTAGAGVASTFIGGAGADTINGDSAADSLVGGAGNDTIVGNGGNDTIAGGAGVDSLTGNAGTDLFQYSAAPATETGLTIATADLITDFTTTADKIGGMGVAGTAANYTEVAAAADFATALAAANVAFAGNAALRYYLTSDTADAVGLLFVNLDGNTTADAVIKMTGVSDATFAFGDIIA